MSDPLGYYKQQFISEQYTAYCVAAIQNGHTPLSFEQWKKYGGGK